MGKMGFGVRCFGGWESVVCLSVLVVVLVDLVGKGDCEVLTPPYFNLAENRRITATATCGEYEPELYCKLVGANADTADNNIHSHMVIQGQVCDFCDKNKEGKAHPAQHAIDGSERWWQSPPLSRGMKYNEVNLTIDLGQEFHVAYVFITTANSPRPGVWVLERSSDDGKTFQPWQYFADTPADCERFFGVESTKGIIRDDSVICDTTYSKVVPLEGGEIVVSLLNNRPSASDFFGSPVLQEWTRATNIRFRLLRTKTLLGHLMSVARQDHSITRRYFYSIKDISIGGRCRCNGHADLCDITDPEDAYKLLCRCQHNTCGAQCESCCPGSVQKAWRPATYTAPFFCEPCNCFGHSNECYYDEEVDRNRTSIDLDGKYEGGGVCQNCRDNTEGINCNKCKALFFRPYGTPLNATNVCQRCACDESWATGNCEEGSGRCECRVEFLAPNCDACSAGFYDYPDCKPCDCHMNGTSEAVCEVGGGQCPCKHNFAGKNCDRCAEGFYNFPQCFPCECEDQGSVSPVCDPVDGQCECNNKFGGRTCSVCEDGYYEFPTCIYCNCDVRGTRVGICDKEGGSCLCREGYGGARCDQCLPSYYGYPECRLCNCSAVGSATTVCDATGKCPCLPNFSGRACDQCTPGYYQYPECLPCECNSDGSMGVSCDDEGKCQCKPNFDGLRCTECREGFYIFPQCEECNCDPAGVVETFSGCGDSPAGELCQCKQRVQGRICNECKPLFWNLQQWNPLGCDDCDCHVPGILGGVEVCEGKTGQCPCKPNVVSRQCDQCKDGYYNLTAENLLGCNDCGCDVGGAVSRFCDKTQGQCVCRPRITGQTCKIPLQTHYFPTLQQFQHEAEDGVTPTGGSVRFGYDERDFEDYSWRGYAVYSQLQPQTNHEVYVDKSSLYRVVLRYINPRDQTVVGEMVASPDNPNDAEFRYKVRFEPKSTNVGNFLTVSQAGNIPAPFVLNPGRWHFSIKSDQYLLIDYFVLLPEAYYEGSILQKKVSEPCLLNVTNTRGKSNIIIPDPCVLLSYPSLDRFDSVRGTESYVNEDGDKSEPRFFYSDVKVLEALKVPSDKLVLLSPQQRELELDLSVNKGGRYALVLEYFTPHGANSTKINIESTSKKGMTKGHALVYNCKHATPCRQVMTNKDGEVAVFRFDQSSINIKLQVPANITDKIAINSVTAVPLGKWSLDHIRPKEYCIVRNGSCILSSYELPPDSTKVEAEASSPERVVDTANLPAGVTDKGLVLLDSNDRSIEIAGMVSNPGYYTFLVHYHQPENPDFALEVVVKNSQYHEARVPIVHCPSTAGCRSPVLQDNNNSRFHLDEDFALTLKSPKNVLIDYVVAVPAPYESPRELEKFLEQTPLDETRRFIAECGKNHMYLPKNTSDFCRDAVFSLTAEYNNGALRCGCDVDGSFSFECEQFGGQCACKDHVIGRRCERCRTGYFGFPNCKPCDCPSTALCDPDNGACICPPRVTGEKCDTCEPLTYGFDALIGCEECDCSPLGVEGGNLQCDMMTGYCGCRQNVIGRRCDHCVPGYWAFPYCQLCDCDLRGTTGDICSQETAECFCKANVEGRSCDTCKVGSFNLEEKNAHGCTKCFCFGKTTRCSSSALFWTQITARKRQITSVIFDPARNILVKEIGFEIEFQEGGSSEESSNFIPVFLPEDTIPEGNESSVMYFRAAMPSNHLASYGGKLTYKLVSDPDPDKPRESFVGPDVILEGQELSPSSNVIRLLHYAVDHLDGDNAMKMSLEMKEENFVVVSPTGGLVAATRDQLMIVLKELRAVYVRAVYWKFTREVEFSAFGLEIGSEEYTSPEYRALTVEQCACPPNYQGLSCEECAPGYFRSPAGPFGGFCVPCQCNGHSDTCDPVSGKCLNCLHKTTGDHCEKCGEGYHGDASHGTPYDCLICACPLPIASNNFATSCELSPDGLEIGCECREGYIGARCEACGPGFYGRPEVQGDYCKPCECSGNIDVSNPGSCDTVTGRCLLCMNNSGGPACSYCAPGYYGDAIDSKDCRSCSCNVNGTEECDRTTGDCRCFNNVVGLNCDRCRQNHFGLSRADGTGCHFCDCGIAAESAQCDDLTGNCKCKKGTTGRRCERCSPGYWNYSEEGCVPCQCNTDYAIGVGCDPGTGQCSCLPGVVGDKCDRCPHRWVLIEDRGCQQCESCHHQLLDSTDAMAALLDPVKDEFASVAVSYFTTQKLAYFNDTAAMLEPSVRLLDPSRVNLEPLYSTVERLEQEAKSSKQKADVSFESLKDKAKSSLKLRDKSFKVESKVQEAVAQARTAVFETKDLMEGLLAKTNYPSPQTDAAMTEAQAIIESMNSVQFKDDDAEQEKKNADKVLREIRDYIAPVKVLTGDIKNDSAKILNIKAKLKDVRNQSDYSIATARKAADISNQIRDAKFPAKILVLEDRVDKTVMNLENAQKVNELTDPNLRELDNSLSALDLLLTDRILESKGPLSENLETLRSVLEKNEDTISKSQEHVRKLREEADELERMLGDTKQTSLNPVSAATAYKNIQEALGEAREKALQAKLNSDNTTTMTTGVEELAIIAKEPSSNLLKMARQSVQNVEQELKIPLDDSKVTMNDIDVMNKNTTLNLNNIDKALDKVTVPKDPSDIEDSKEVSAEAITRAEEALASVEETMSAIPQDTNNARLLPRSVNDLNKGIEISDSQLKQAKDSIPLSEAITGSLEEKKPSLESKKAAIESKLGDLRAKIYTAREQANRVPVGVNLEQSSSLLLANPQSLESQQTQTKLSLYFKTQEPEGLILYLGNEQGRKGEEDFLALEVDRGYPILTVDLGSGPQTIRNPMFVADDKWYKATVNRVGKAVQFIITEEDQFEQTKEYASDGFIHGPKSLFNVDKNSSKLYVGGIPPGEVKSPLRYTSYRGIVEDLTIGDEKVGLWNFREAQNVQPAMERDRFVDLRPQTGLRFQGNGFAILDRRQYQFREKSAIRLSFQTRSPNGLLFLVGTGPRFLSIEIVDGRVVFQYDLGSGTATIQTPEAYNDGRWHQVDAVRYRQDGSLKVDSAVRGTGKSPDAQNVLQVSDHMYFGGYPGQHHYPQVSQKGFDGCIDNVTVDDRPVDLTQSVESRYTVVGCPSPQFDQVVATFGGDGYVMVPSGDAAAAGPAISVNEETFELNFRIRSSDTHGLVFYGANPDQSNYLSVSLAEGSLYVKTEPGGGQVRTDPLNDANWHVVTVTRDRNRILVNVDDVSEYFENAGSGPLYLSEAGSTLYFGGKPEDYVMAPGAAVADVPFNGCLSDIHMNGKRVNFTRAVVKDSRLGQKCGGGEVTAEEVSRDHVSPTIPIEDSGEDLQPPRPTPTTTTTSRTFGPEDFDREPTTSTTSTPRRTMKPTKVAPTPYMQCALPYRNPPTDEDMEDVSMEDGVSFGNLEKTSHMEFRTSEDDKSRSLYTIEFNTASPDGLLFFRSDFIKSDFVALFMKKGILHFAFDSGSGPAILNSTKALNDSQWHTALFSRYRNQGELTVDGVQMATGNSPGSTTDINAGPTLYIGGLPEEAWNKKLTSKKLLGIDSAFRGCLRNFLVRNKSPGSPTHLRSVQPCSDAVEPGFFFYPNSGYLRIARAFKVGVNIKISLSVKPRHPSGLIMSVHGRKDYIVLQMINGTVKFTVNNGHGPISSSFTKGTYDLCDGKWHTILATKTKNVATLAIDGQHAQVGMGPVKSSATDTNHPVFLGGQPNPSAPGIETTEQFVGCIRDFVIHDRPPFRFTYNAIVGTVGSHSCPID